jgi:hypothetical protein
MALMFLLTIIRCLRLMALQIVMGSAVYKSMWLNHYFSSLPLFKFLFKNSNNNLYGPPITLNYDRGSSSYSGPPSTLYTNQSASSLRHPQQVHHDPQGRISSLLMATDRPPKYCRNPNLDESAPISSSSNGYNTNEKSGRSSQIPPNSLYTPVADPNVGLTSTAIPGRREENVSTSSWKSGYP